MAKSTERRLQVVPELPRERRDTLRARFGETDDDRLERLMRREFGSKVLDIVCNELFVFENHLKPGVIAFDHAGAHVAGLFMGIEHVMERKVPATRNPVVPLDVMDTRVFPLAVFSTAIGPLFSELTREQMRAADLNDTGSASMYQRIGVKLDEPVTFGALENRYEDHKESAPAKLRVIQ